MQGLTYFKADPFARPLEAPSDRRLDFSKKFNPTRRRGNRKIPKENKKKNEKDTGSV